MLRANVVEDAIYKAQGMEKTQVAKWQLIYTEDNLTNCARKQEETLSSEQDAEITIIAAEIRLRIIQFNDKLMYVYKH